MCTIRTCLFVRKAVWPVLRFILPNISDKLGLMSLVFFDFIDKLISDSALTNTARINEKKVNFITYKNNSQIT